MGTIRPAVHIYRDPTNITLGVNAGVMFAGTCGTWAAGEREADLNPQQAEEALQLQYAEVYPISRLEPSIPEGERLPDISELGEPEEVDVP